jgi:hypothetical protein
MSCFLIQIDLYISSRLIYCDQFVNCKICISENYYCNAYALMCNSRHVCTYCIDMPVDLSISFTHTNIKSTTNVVQDNITPNF